MAVRILEDHVINQIAAGEVVERPASVVRELLQNALDAGARAIRVELRGGGTSLVRVSDDGSGMNRDDALMALERHATSKIRTADDLASVATLGFRGEALPSIAAVSRFELRTRPREDEVGTRIRVEGGTLLDVADVGCAPGTEIEVRSLFFNVPARRKFLRSKQTELGHCVGVVLREALLRPDLDVVVRHEDRDALRAPRAGGIGERVAALIEEGGALLQVDGGDGGIAVRGLVSPIGVHRATAAGAVFLYVNGRYVQDPLLRRAVYEAYRDRVPRGRYPVVVLDVGIDPGRVDVNVHPTKVEVRFFEPIAVAGIVTEQVRRAVDAAGRGPIRRDPSLATAAPGPLFRPVPDPLPLQSRVPETPTPAPRPLPPSAPKGPPTAHPDDDPAFRAHPEPPPLLAAEPRGPGRFRELRVLGVVGARWLVCAEGPNLVLIDVHAARERLFATGLARGEPALGHGQRLLAPARVALTHAQADRLERVADALSRCGVDIDRFGPLEVAVRGLPGALAGVDPRALLVDLADGVERGGDGAIAGVLARRASAAAPAPEGTDGRLLLAMLDEAGFAPGPPLSARLPADEIARRVEGR